MGRLAYYAHCQSLYDTKQETRDIELMEDLGFEVRNPNDPNIDAYFDDQKFDREERMMFFKKFVDICDVIIFRALPDGRISSGVVLELEWFKAAGKPALELPSGILKRSIGLEETREYIREAGKR